MIRWQKLAATAALALAAIVSEPNPSTAQVKPEGELRYAVYATMAPAWFDPGESVVGVLTPFWISYALHDAVVKPMPGERFGAALAESWTVSDDQRTFEFKLRPNLTFHNGDPFTAEDVVFSFNRAKAPHLLRKVKEVTVIDPLRVRFVLHEPWPDFMTFYGTFATGAAWVMPKRYMEQVGGDGFKRHPIGLGPYKFVSSKPGLEIILEAHEGYWRKMPTVKRLVFKSIPEQTTRLAMLQRDEVDIAYLLDADLAAEAKRNPKLKLAFSGGIGTYYLDFLDMWDPKSPWADQRVRRAASLAMDRKAISDAETLGASPPNGNIVPPGFEFALKIEADPYDPVQAKKLLAEAGYPNGFDGGDLYPWPPYFTAGEAINAYLGAVGIRTRLRTMERAVFYSALASKKLKGVCMCVNAIYGNASSRLAETVPSDGAFAYGGYPDVDAMYKAQAVEMDVGKRTALLHQVQRTLHERTRFAPIFDYTWVSGIGPRVADPALMLINPYPWSAPLEEVRLNRP